MVKPDLATSSRKRIPIEGVFLGISRIVPSIAFTFYVDVNYALCVIMRMRRWKSKVRAPSPALTVITKFGGITALGRAMGKGTSTVQRWLDAGFIPPRYQAEILLAADTEAIELEPADFVPSAAHDEESLLKRPSNKRAETSRVVAA